MIASCRAHGLVFENSSEGMVFVLVIERRMANSLVSSRLRRDIMSDIVVGGMGIDTCGNLMGKASRDFVFLSSNARSSRAAVAFSILIAFRQPSVASAEFRSGAPLNVRVLVNELALCDLCMNEPALCDLCIGCGVSLRTHTIISFMRFATLSLYYHLRSGAVAQ